MKAQSNKTAGRLLVGLILLATAATGCDTWEDVPNPEIAQASFTATNYWPSFGEDIQGAGSQVFRVAVQEDGNGAFEVQIRSQSLDAQFDGLSSGDDYDSWLAVPSQYEFKGNIGTIRELQETIMLKNERTGQEAEGLVVAKAEIMPGGGVSFSVKEVISLP